MFDCRGSFGGSLWSVSDVFLFGFTVLVWRSFQGHQNLMDMAGLGAKSASGSRRNLILESSGGVVLGLFVVICG